MADNTTLDAGTGGDVIASDDIAGVKHQRVKVQYGDDGAATDVSDTNPLPVDDAGGSLTVDGTVTANLSATDNAVLDNIDTDTSNIQTAVELIDDAIVADDAAFTPATTKVMMAGFEFDDTTPDSVDEGDGGAARMSSRREVYTQIRDAAGNERGANVDASGNLQVDVAASSATVTVDGSGVTQPVSGTVTANAGSGTFTVDGSAVTQPVSISDTSFAVADGSALGEGVLVQGDDGTDRKNINVDATTGDVQVDVTNTVTVDLGANNDVTLNANSGVDIGDVDILSIAAGDNNIGNVDIVTLPASTNTLEIVGDVAHSAPAAGNPVLSCGVAQDADDTAPPNRVDTESDATRLATDFDGALFTRPHGPQIWSYHVDGSSALTDVTVHAAPGANLSLYVTDIIISSGAATAINVFFEESTTTVLGPYYLEATAGRGAVIRFSTPKKITANTALTVTSSAAIAHSIDVTGYVGQG